MPSPKPGSLKMRSLQARRGFALKEPPRRGGARHLGRGRPHGRLFTPTDNVRETGIYEVIHHGEHRATHDAVMLSGDTFPVCDTCAHAVRFRLVRTAPYIFQDADFEDPDEAG